MKRTSIFILQVLLWFVVSLVITTPANAAMPAAQQTQVIQTLEDTLFAVRYDQEAPDARLSRLEETVFGQAQSNLSTEARINKLQSALSPSTLGALSPLAKKTSPATTNTATSNQASPKTTSTQQAAKPTAANNGLNNIQSVQQAVKPTPGETDYPTVSQMEMKLFGKAFVQEDITQRLTRLEKQVFKTQQNGALADRVDNLRLVVLGDTGTGSNSAVTTTNNGYQVFSPAGSIPPQYAQLPSQGYSPQYGQIPGPGTVAPGYDSNVYPNASAYSPYGPSGMSAYQPSPYPNSGAPVYNRPGEQPVAYAPPSTMGGNGQITPDMLNAMNETEKEVLGHTYDQEPMNTRLDRLESKIFNTTSPEMATEDRLQRVIAVSSAGGAPQSPQARAKTTIQTLLPIILTILPMILL